ncbi:hypothetical protein [Tunturiibacter gelidiferens]|uniref:hypothetical protein n=1 Tax=Tunturiibacter gelidiferens TaxID=3069689 RepID=UPI003D9BEC7C
MIIVGVDYHPSVQQVAFLDTETGETGERRLSHSDGEAERLCRDLQRRQVKVRVGIEATGHARWFEQLLAELKFELWIAMARKLAVSLCWMWRKGFDYSQTLQFDSHAGKPVALLERKI